MNTFLSNHLVFSQFWFFYFYFYYGKKECEFLTADRESHISMLKISFRNYCFPKEKFWIRENLSNVDVRLHILYQLKPSWQGGLFYNLVSISFTVSRDDSVCDLLCFHVGLATVYDKGEWLPRPSIWPHVESIKNSRTQWRKNISEDIMLRIVFLNVENIANGKNVFDDAGALSYMHLRCLIWSGWCKHWQIYQR